MLPPDPPSDYGSTRLAFALANHRDRFGDAFAEASRLYIEHRAALHALWSAGPSTVIHGDAHIGNLFFDHGRTGFLDWGMIVVSTPLRDVSYFLQMALSVEDRRREDRRLLQTYLDARRALGGTPLDAEDAFRTYRIQAAYLAPASCQVVTLPDDATPARRVFAAAFQRRAEAAIEDLAELYRMVMADTKNLTTLARELDLTRQYLNLEQLRLGERLIVDWQTAEAPRDALVPPLLLQPLVENAVYHGIEPGIEPGTIVIAIRRDKDRVHLKLTNPYHPEHQHRQGNRIALANIRERLALHFDVEGVLESGVKGSSYEIRMMMPYRRAAPHTVPGERAAA